MLDDVSLARLAEMGVDVYTPRGAGVAQRSPDWSGEPTASRAPCQARARVVVLARSDDASSKNLLAQVVRAFAFASVDVIAESSVHNARIGDAAALVVFGDVLAREVGAAVSADRLKKIPSVAVGEASDVAASAAAKRALWSELRRVMRKLGAGR